MATRSTGCSVWEVMPVRPPPPPKPKRVFGTAAGVSAGWGATSLLNVCASSTTASADRCTSSGL
ncbi:MAG: hypothetical protein AMJ79_15340 [Phycisphaerae bacterium SM23_30]|nr:MAG: hypothetical protein AMJ79_15340 [Phycisphaerae bacterium SM23_30]